MAGGAMGLRVRCNVSRIQWKSPGDDPGAKPLAPVVGIPKHRDPFRRLGDQPHANGTLHQVQLNHGANGSRWKDDSFLRIWTPPGYEGANSEPLPVLYFTDGQNMFLDRDADGGVSWQAGFTAASLIEGGVIPPCLLVGLDNTHRSLKYAPVPPSADAPWKADAVEAYLDTLVSDVLPTIGKRFNASTHREQVALGGAGLGGMFALHAAMRSPEVFGGILSQSPDLWLDNLSFLDELCDYRGDLPDKLYLGMGHREYSSRVDNPDGISQDEAEETDALLVELVQEAAQALSGRSKLMLAVDEVDDGSHSTGAWRQRFPAALSFLKQYSAALQPDDEVATTVSQVLASKVHFKDKLITAPYLVNTGESATLLFNRERSNLGDRANPSEPLRMRYAFNGWSIPSNAIDVDMLPCKLAKMDGHDWFKVDLRIPEDEVHEMNMVFHQQDTNGHTLWDNNGGNFTIPCNVTARTMEIVEERRAREKAKREAEEARLAEERRIAEEARLKEEARLAEIARAEEEARVKEEARLAEIARVEEEKRVIEEARQENERQERERAAALIREAEEEARRRAEAEINARREKEAAAAAAKFAAEEKVRVKKEAELAKKEAELAAREAKKQAQVEAKAAAAAERAAKQQAANEARAKKSAEIKAKREAERAAARARAEEQRARRAVEQQAREEAVIAKAKEEMRAREERQAAVFAAQKAKEEEEAAAKAAREAELAEREAEEARQRDANAAALKAMNEQQKAKEEKDARRREAEAEAAKAAEEEARQREKEELAVKAAAEAKAWEEEQAALGAQKAAEALAAVEARQAEEEEARRVREAEAEAERATTSYPASDDPQTVLRAARRALRTDPSCVVFTCPEVPVAGQAARLCVIQKNSSIPEVAEAQHLLFKVAFNNWTASEQWLAVAECDQAGELEVLSATLEVPQGAEELNCVLCSDDTCQVYDNNEGKDWTFSMEEVDTAPKVPRSIESCEDYPLAGGTMSIVRLQPKPGAESRSRWKEERILRVWTPPGYDPEKAPEGGLPVVYLNDGKNLFEDWLAHQGVSWRTAETAARLVAEGTLPPFMVVGIDAPGAFRSQNYLPFPPGVGAGGFRPEARRWPGGGAHDYMERVVHEIMPLVESHFAASSDPSKVVFGGGSFGGVCALYAGMHYAHKFGGVLAESPSFWSKEGQFLEDMETHDKGWSARLYMAVGTAEYSATRDMDSPELDQLLLDYSDTAEGILKRKGYLKGENFMYTVEEGAGHHESAWGYRLYDALKFLGEPWTVRNRNDDATMEHVENEDEEAEQGQDELTPL